MSTSLVNSQGEKIEIHKVEGGKFKDQSTLVLHDDWPSTATAYHLLDDKTVDWLLVELQKLKDAR
ncbi:MAG: hypothetical protein KUG81_04120 [Gammaproteobacteria bacterium]|nr:hypothetical protein [Gammaproteobacteria bacterium]